MSREGARLTTYAAVMPTPTHNRCMIQRRCTAVEFSICPAEYTIATPNADKRHAIVINLRSVVGAVRSMLPCHFDVIHRRVQVELDDAFRDARCVVTVKS